MSEHQTKTCRKCLEIKPADEFCVNTNRAGGRDPCCKVCRRAESKAWRDKNAGRLKQRRQERGDELREMRRRWAKRYPEKNRARAARYAAAKKRHTPPWLTKEQRAQMRAIYASVGPGENVDHLWPLKGSDAWGLHVPWNLWVVSAEANSAKGNKPPSLLERMLYGADPINPS